jgi:hypothetical protein
MTVEEHRAALAFADAERWLRLIHRDAEARGLRFLVMGPRWATSLRAVILDERGVKFDIPLPRPYGPSLRRIWLRLNQGDYSR